MPRRPRLFVPGAIYHVYCRVARGETVFDDPGTLTFTIAADQRRLVGVADAVSYTDEADHHRPLQGR